ncbi:hypothetical protein WN55_10089 [Dufourea novaeangliae]|uniref:Uncharacterized protein n=2 Tax=Dufourea novaeangliae TaxID=178035 RepID=A0A154P4X2_DUFNO|nr:hypothetical protein WN55_10089 [Dufourea novaeangliae]
MKYPYTLSAKLAQFPYAYYFHNKSSWVFKYWAISFFVCLPVFYKIQKLSNHPDNVKKWDEIHKKEFSGEVHH